MQKNIVIIACSGKGTRMGNVIPKQFLNLNDKPIIYHTISKFERCNKIDEIIIVVSKDYEQYFKDEILKKYDFKKVSNVVLGGKERINSVYNGLCSIKKKDCIVLIHDGVRPFIETEYIEKIIEETKIHKACVLGVKAKDTIKICKDNFIKDTPNRENIWLAQTPQAFEYSLLKNLYEKAIKENLFATDDASILEHFGYNVKMVLGDYKNIKITTPEDLEIGKLFL